MQEKFCGNTTIMVQQSVIALSAGSHLEKRQTAGRFSKVVYTVRDSFHPIYNERAATYNILYYIPSRSDSDLLMRKISTRNVTVFHNFLNQFSYLWNWTNTKLRCKWVSSVLGSFITPLIFYRYRYIGAKHALRRIETDYQ